MIAGDPERPKASTRFGRLSTLASGVPLTLLLSGCLAQPASRSNTDIIYHNPARADFSAAGVKDMDAMASRLSACSQKRGKLC